MAISIAIYLKVGCSPYVNKAFVYKAFVYILNFSFYSIINDQDTTIRLCKNIK
jgi:hypothetical protein